MILRLSFRRVIQIVRNLPRVWYPVESISQEYDTPASQSPRGIILRRVNLPGYIIPRGVNLPLLLDPEELLMNPGSQHPFLKTFAQAFKGTVSLKYMLIPILLIKGYIKNFWKNF